MGDHHPPTMDRVTGREFTVSPPPISLPVDPSKVRVIMPVDPSAGAASSSSSSSLLPGLIPREWGDWVKKETTQHVSYCMPGIEVPQATLIKVLGELTREFHANVIKLRDFFGVRISTLKAMFTLQESSKLQKGYNPFEPEIGAVISADHAVEKLNGTFQELNSDILEVTGLLKRHCKLAINIADMMLMKHAYKFADMDRKWIVDSSSRANAYILHDGAGGGTISRLTHMKTSFVKIERFLENRFTCLSQYDSAVRRLSEDIARTQTMPTDRTATQAFYNGLGKDKYDARVQSSIIAADWDNHVWGELNGLIKEMVNISRRAEKLARIVPTGEVYDPETAREEPSGNSKVKQRRTDGELVSQPTSPTFSPPHSPTTTTTTTTTVSAFSPTGAGRGGGPRAMQATVRPYNFVYRLGN